MTPIHLEPEPMNRLLPGDGGIAPPSAARSGTAGNGTQAIFRLDMMRSFELHRKPALGIAIAGVVLAVAYWFYVGPVYQAESIVYIQPSPPRVMPQGPNFPYAQRWPYDSNTYESYITQQMENVTRADVLAGAVRKLQSSDWLKSGESDQAAADRLKYSIKVKRLPSSYQFTIDSHAGDGQAAADAANALANSFIESCSHEQKAGDMQRLAILGEERDRVQKALDADRAEQATLNKQLGVASIGAAPDVYDEDIGRIHGELVTARTAHDQAAARLTSMDANQGSSSALDAAADEIVAADAGLQSMKTSLNQRRATLISQMANLTPNHPLYKQDAAELAQINSNLDAMMTDLRAKAAERIQLKLRSDLEQTAGVEARLNGQLAQLTGAAGGATSKMQRASDLAIDITRLQSRFTVVDEEWRNLTLEEGAPGSAYLSAAATAPTHAAMAGKLRNAGLLIFAGLFFGMMAAVVAHKMDPAVYIASDVERILGFAPMAQLPDFNEVPAGVSEEHLLRLAASIEHARQQGRLKCCIFTGTGPGTGVTTLLGKMRDLLEAMGRPTMLVDATGTTSGAAQAGGGEGTQALIQQQRGRRPSALLQQMAEESKAQAESLVLTDTAPLALSAETEYLARFVDCAIVVVRSGVTTRAELRETAATLQRLDVAAVGFILNRVGLEKADPAFRLSVKAIEKHLDTQSGSLARRGARNRLIAEEAAPQEELYSREAVVLPQMAAVVAEPMQAQPVRLTAPAVAAATALPQYAAAIPETVPAARLAPPAAPLRAAKFAATAVAPVASYSTPAVATYAAPVVASYSTPAVTTAVPKLPRQTPQRKQEAIEPMTNESSNLPWWLADLDSKADGRPSTASGEETSARRAQEIADQLRPEGVEPLRRPQAPAVQSWDQLPRVPAGRAALSAAYRPTAVEEVAHAEPEENSTGLATRLSGLRSLFSMVGAAAETTAKEARATRPVDPAIERAADARTSGAAALAGSNGNGNSSRVTGDPGRTTGSHGRVTGSPGRTTGSPGRLTAAPEFLPPRAEVEQAEESRSSRFGSRREREDDFEVAHTLPSRRGQYKR